VTAVGPSARDNAGGPPRSPIASAVVGIHSRYLGRGPTKAQAFFRGNVVVLMLDDLVEAVEELTGGHVLAFMSDGHVEPELVVELYILDRPVAARLACAGGA
jgi:uncharacterized protein YbcI